MAGNRNEMNNKNSSSKNYTIKVGRDSKNGQFITVKEADRRPSTTEVEHIKVPKHK